MHAISPYSVRCFNSNIKSKKIEDRYAILDKIGQFDIYQIFSDFFNEQDGSYKLLEETKQVYRFSDIVCDDGKREISGWMQAGSYGTKNNIIDIKTGKVDFEKAQHNAEIVEYYIRFYLPKGVNEGIALLHSYKSVGIKTVLHEVLKQRFQSITKMAFQMHPLAYEKAFENWKDAAAKEIKLVKFKGMNDVADQIKALGHREAELSIKPPRRSSLGKLKDFFEADSEKRAAIEVLTPLCAEVKTVVEMNGKKRTFRIGVAPAQQLCEIEVDEDKVPIIAGNPDHQAMHEWCREILKEYMDIIYPNQKAKK